MAREQRRYIIILHATSTANSATTADHAIPDNIVQETNRATTGISSMHVNNEADESNIETEYNSEYDNNDDDDSDPTPGACFHQFSHQTNKDAGCLNPLWISATALSSQK